LAARTKAHRFSIARIRTEFAAYLWKRVRRNQAWFEVSRSMPSGDVRAGFVPSRLRMLEAFRALEEVSPDAVEWFEESGALHYAAHAEDLRRFLGEGET